MKKGNHVFYGCYIEGAIGKCIQDYLKLLCSVDQANGDEKLF